MFGPPGAATCKKEHEYGHHIQGMCDNIDSDSKLLSVVEKCMGNDLCKPLYGCTDTCMGDVVIDDECKELLPQMDYSTNHRLGHRLIKKAAVSG